MSRKKILEETNEEVQASPAAPPQSTCKMIIWKNKTDATSSAVILLEY